MYAMMKNQANGVLDQFMIIVPNVDKVEDVKILIKAAKRVDEIGVDVADILQVVQTLENKIFRPSKLGQKYYLDFIVTSALFTYNSTAYLFAGDFSNLSPPICQQNKVQFTGNNCRHFCICT